MVLFSCSPDEETEAPTNTVQTTTPEPVVVQYTLTVSAAEGGSIDNTGDTYNENSSVTEEAKAKSVAVLGNISVIIATTIGITVTYIRNAPVFSGVICWALTAVSFGLKKRLSLLLDNNDIDKIKNKNKNKVGIYGAKTQQTLCQIGAIACAMTSAFVVAFSGRGTVYI